RHTLSVFLAGTLVCGVFLPGKVLGWGADSPGAARLCQRFYNRYHFATLYDTNHRIAVYSAYRFQPSNGGGREKRWFVEPQFIFNPSPWGGEMKDGYWLGKDHPGVYLGERKALNEDYTHSDKFCNATFTLTNVVPQNPKLNQNAWARHESQLTDLFKAQCAQAYVLVGAIPSTDNWIVNDNIRRVNIPEYIRNCYCCVDNNGEPVHSGVDQRSLLELNGFLQQYSKQGTCFTTTAKQ
uniref:DNA/RNA non-specific endonuclease domain-containing protein n=1 Tax=Oncorhynchus mykiss TaxID=8022 RepID=A0A8C7V6Z6_ONCMY